MMIKVKPAPLPMDRRCGGEEAGDSFRRLVVGLTVHTMARETSTIVLVRSEGVEKSVVASSLSVGAP